MLTVRSNSLWFRLVLSAVIISTSVLLVAAFLLNAIFVHALQDNFDQKLRSDLDGILANVELSLNGKPVLQTQLADSRFSLPLSGWYWQISDSESNEVLVASPSLLESKIPSTSGATAPDKSGTSAYSAVDVGEKNLRVIYRVVDLFGSPKKFAIRISGNFDELNGEITSFQKTLFAVLTGLGITLLTALIFQVRFALQPLAEMRRQLNAVRGGQADRLGGNFPTEIQPLANELNLLVEANREVVDRARMQVGNLAHALKTPLSVIGNETRNSTSPLAKKLREQIVMMNNHITLYLDRARRAARAHTAGASTEVAPVVEALARTVQRIQHGRKIEFKIDIPTGLRFRGECQDLEEMLGNLLDNAGKWANKKSWVTAQIMPLDSKTARGWLELTVEDDGPGIPEDRRTDAVKRGQRLDETKMGSGLGMSIISETAAMYSGDLKLESSELGGLKARLKLPMVV